MSTLRSSTRNLVSVILFIVGVMGFGTAGYVAAGWSVTDALYMVVMARVGGMHYRCDPAQKIGSRISDMTLQGRPIDPTKIYKVAGWASVAEGAVGEPIWDVLGRYLRDKKVIRAVRPNRPTLHGIQGNPGIVFGG